MVKKIIGIGIVVGLLFGLVFKNRIISYFSEDTRSVNKTEVKLLFKTPPSYSALVSTLMEKGVIDNDKHFKDYISDNSIDTNQFAAGKYVILSQTRLNNLVNGFVVGENGHGNAEVKVNVIFNNCPTIESMAKNISECISADSSSLVDYIFDSETLKKYSFTREEVPALFLPKKREMYYDTDAEEFVSIMAVKFKEFWTNDRKEKMRSLGFDSPSQVATLASIVYSEQSKVSDEWPIIAKLYLNRLHKGMRLESDPTFKFCWGDKLDGVERLLYVHRDIDCEYNTYKMNGLPPGPIYVVPGSVIDAVLNPAEVDYLFMCGKPGGGGHNFAVTNAQHERNASIYRKWLVQYQKEKRENG